MRPIAKWLAVSAAAAALALACGAPGGSPARAASGESLLPAPERFAVPEAWRTRRIGSREFYFGAQGPYWFFQERGRRILRQVGLLDRLVPGDANLKERLNSFAPEVRETLPPSQRQLVKQWLAEEWPIFSYELMTFQGEPGPSPEAQRVVDELWIGDGSPEQAYRLEPVLHYARTGRPWRGSSMHMWDDQALRAFMEERLFPRLEREVPGFRDPGHEWTHADLRRFEDLYVEEFFAPVGRAVAWGSQAPYHMVSLPSTVAVGEKNVDPLTNARARGAMRGAAGNEFYMAIHGQGPTERWAFIDRVWMARQERDFRGLPLPWVRLHLFRPWVEGVNLFVLEQAPQSLVKDLEGDDQWELSALGEIAVDLLDLADRHPERGVPYAPVALLLDADRELPGQAHPGTTYRGHELPFDAADHMTAGVLDLLFPVHPHFRFTAMGRMAPYGELFDILSPNPRGGPVDAEVLAPYPVLFGLGGLRVDEDFARVLRDYVRQGGALVLNVEDRGALPDDFFGVEVGDGSATARRVTCALDGRAFEEAAFPLRPVALRGAEAVYTSEGRPVVIRHRVGEGHVLLVAASRMLQDATETRREGRLRKAYEARPLLRFSRDLFDHLVESVSPVRVRTDDEHRTHLSWSLNRKGEGWTVAVRNWSLERDLAVEPRGHSTVVAEHRLRARPFTIETSRPVADALEWTEDRDVRLRREDGRTVVSESIRGGALRIYELQPEPIVLPERRRPVNHARGRPVRASSHFEDLSPGLAVDGDRANDRFWQSGTGKRGNHFTTPQWLEVDLETPRTLDRAFVLFHHWPDATLDTRLHVVQWKLEGSRDGEDWTLLVDETRNADPADARGLERWFEPVEARYVRLTVLRNAAYAGAQVVELEVSGPERERFRPARGPAPPPEPGITVRAKPAREDRTR